MTLRAWHTFCCAPEPLPSSPSGSFRRLRPLCSPPWLENKHSAFGHSDPTRHRFVFSVNLTAVVDVIRVAVLRLLLLLLLARVTAGHDEVTRSGDVGFLCRQEVTQRNTTVLLPDDALCVGIGWLYLLEVSPSWRRPPCPS